jgi:drug/metabolite transporter (DMT)-like permease
MQNAAFYVIVVMIWGTTFIGIKFQLGTVDPAVSIAYRFSLAAIILMLWCRIRGLNMRFAARDHLFLILKGACLFSFNYWLFYLATSNLTSGLVAVIFSSILVMNLINGAILLGSPVEKKVVIGGAVGLCGIGLVFRPELTTFSLDDAGLSGVLLCLAASYLASLGNMITARNHKRGIPIVQANAYAISYGAAIMLIITLISGREFNFDPRAGYVLSLGYLAIFGTVIAFGCYLSLVGSIGASRAAYSTLLFPVVALVVSTIFEGYQWSAYSLSGMCLVLLGNLLIIKKPASKASPSLAAGQKA